MLLLGKFCIQINAFNSVRYTIIVSFLKTSFCTAISRRNRDAYNGQRMQRQLYFIKAAFSNCVFFRDIFILLIGKYTIQSIIINVHPSSFFLKIFLSTVNILFLG